MNDVQDWRERERDRNKLNSGLLYINVSSHEHVLYISYIFVYNFCQRTEKRLESCIIVIIKL